jgi:hypothetical protein
MDNLKSKAKPLSLMQPPEHVIPAQSGFELILWSCLEDDKFLFERCPIIAWRVGSTVLPITVRTADDGDLGARMAILLPNGKVEDVFGERSHESLEAWEASARADWVEGRRGTIAKEPAAAKPFSLTGGA